MKWRGVEWRGGGETKSWQLIFCLLYRIVEQQLVNLVLNLEILSNGPSCNIIPLSTKQQQLKKHDKVD